MANYSLLEAVKKAYAAASEIATAIANHEVKADAHQISGVAGLREELDAGFADAAALATAVAALAARVTALEGREFTTLIPATYPSGAPHDTHETVVSELPANITNNSTYTLPNPFGINTRADVVIEIWVNGRWAEPGWDGNSGTGGTAYGADASYVQGVGIVVQTGVHGVAGASNQLGGGVANNTWGVVSAPCRVAIRKWEA